MQTLLGSLMGVFGTTQLHTILLLGMLVLVIFRPERIGNWRAFRLAVVFLAIAVALPGFMILWPTASGASFDQELGLMRYALAAGSALTAVSIVALLSCFAGWTEPGRVRVPGGDATD